jgi:hypothetical protein
VSGGGDRRRRHPAAAFGGRRAAAAKAVDCKKLSSFELKLSWRRLLGTQEDTFSGDGRSRPSPAF